MRQMTGVGERHIELKSVNPHITCPLCLGYMVDATTITECLHTFCKSCIVKYLEEQNTCPKCQMLIHQSYPLNYISHDRTMQDIVCKLVPHLLQDEIRRELEFYKQQGIKNPKLLAVDEKENQCIKTEIIEPVKPYENTDEDYHRSDEQVSLCLENSDTILRPLKRKYLQCSVQITITHLKKFLSLKLFRDISRYKDVEVLCNEEILGKDHTLKFISMTRWRNKDAPMQLNYRTRIDL